MKADCVIEEGLNKLETKRGWVKGELYVDGSVCAIGAVNVGLMMCGEKNKDLMEVPSCEDGRTKKDILTTLEVLKALWDELPSAWQEGFTARKYEELNSKSTKGDLLTVIESFESDIISYNDSRSDKRPVVKLFKKALASLRKDQ